MALIDINGDHRPDVIITNREGFVVAILRNDCGGLGLTCAPVAHGLDPAEAEARVGLQVVALAPFVERGDEHELLIGGRPDARA